MAEGAPLLRVYRLYPIEGSNPSLSAMQSAVRDFPQRLTAEPPQSPLFSGFLHFWGWRNSDWETGYLSGVRRQTLWDQLTLFLRDTFLPVDFSSLDLLIAGCVFFSGSVSGFHRRTLIQNVVSSAFIDICRRHVVQ